MILDAVEREMRALGFHIEPEIAFLSQRFNAKEDENSEDVSGNSEFMLALLLEELESEFSVSLSDRQKRESLWKKGCVADLVKWVMEARAKGERDHD